MRPARLVRIQVRPYRGQIVFGIVDCLGRVAWCWPRQPAGAGQFGISGEHLVIWHVPGDRARHIQRIEGRHPGPSLRNLKTRIRKIQTPARGTDRDLQRGRLRGGDADRVTLFRAGY